MRTTDAAEVNGLPDHFTPAAAAASVAFYVAKGSRACYVAIFIKAYYFLEDLKS